MPQLINAAGDGGCSPRWTPSRDSRVMGFGLWGSCSARSFASRKAASGYGPGLWGLCSARSAFASRKVHRLLQRQLVREDPQLRDRPSPTLSPTDPVPRGLLILCPAPTDPVGQSWPRASAWRDLVSDLQMSSGNVERERERERERDLVFDDEIAHGKVDTKLN